MKQIKLKARDLNKTLEELLTKLGAVDQSRKKAYPNYVYMSKQDYTKLQENYAKAFKKQYPGLSSNKVKASVGMAFLNLGPSQLLEAAIRPGYVIVDTERIEQEIKSDETIEAVGKVLEEAKATAKEAEALVKSREYVASIGEAIVNYFKNLFRRKQ